MQLIKIKDDIDMSILKEFGFQSVRSGFSWVKGTGKIMYSVDSDRLMQISTPCSMMELLDSTIYDLTKANIVEIVEEENCNVQRWN